MRCRKQPDSTRHKTLPFRIGSLSCRRPLLRERRNKIKIAAKNLLHWICGSLRRFPPCYKNRITTKNTTMTFCMASCASTSDAVLLPLAIMESPNPCSYCLDTVSNKFSVLGLASVGYNAFVLGDKHARLSFTTSRREGDAFRHPRGDPPVTAWCRRHQGRSQMTWG